MTPKEAATILWSYLCVRDEPETADAAFVFGSSAVDLVTAKAAELFARGLAPVVLVTGNHGGRGPAFSKSEAETFADRLIELGVPTDAILQEREAMNTGENVLMGMRVLSENGLRPARLLLVGKPPHMRRCQATFAKRFPGIPTCACPAEGGMEDWAKISRMDFDLRLAQEIERLERYAELGYLVPQTIPAEVKQAADAITRSFAE